MTQNVYRITWISKMGITKHIDFPSLYAAKVYLDVVLRDFQYQPTLSRISTGFNVPSIRVK